MIREIEQLTSRIQDGGTEVVQAKAGAVSATLSMAYAAVKFADACLRGLRGDAGVVECAFEPSQVTELPFFVTKLRLVPPVLRKFTKSGSSMNTRGMIHLLDKIREVYQGEARVSRKH